MTDDERRSGRRDHRRRSCAATSSAGSTITAGEFMTARSQDDRAGRPGRRGADPVRRASDHDLVRRRGRGAEAGRRAAHPRLPAGAMNAVILIPARFASSRYPGKPLVELKGASGAAKPLIQRSVEAARRVPGVSGVFVVTDDERIADACTRFGVGVIMTSPECRNGTERCAEALGAAPRPRPGHQFPGRRAADAARLRQALIDRMARRPRCAGRDPGDAPAQRRSARAAGRGSRGPRRRDQRRHRRSAAARSISRSG